jgi:polyisoprenoid-binding protein YceI
MKPRTLIACLPALLLANSALGSEWNIDPEHSEAKFDIHNMLVGTAHGTLGTVTGTIHYDDQDISHSTVSAAIDLTKIDTHEPKRDKHLQSKDFFETATFPTATFTSNKVERLANGKLQITGDLKVHGVTRSVVLAVDMPSPGAASRLTAAATTTINRHDIGLNWGPGIMLSSDAHLQIKIEAAPGAAAAVVAAPEAPPAPVLTKRVGAAAGGIPQ